MHNTLTLLLNELELVANLLRTSPRHLVNEGRFHRSGAGTVLQLLGREGPRTVPHLARAQSTSRQNMQMIINRLASAGHLEMRPNPAHKRSDLFDLTESGRVLLARIAERENKFLEELAHHISERDAGSARTVILRLREFLSQRNGSKKIRHHGPARKAHDHKIQTGDSLEQIGSTLMFPNEIQSEGNELPVSLL